MSTPNPTTNRARGRSNLADRLAPLALSYPSLLFVTVFIVWPVAFEVVLSFSYRDAYTGAQRPNGLANYAYVLADESFWKALANAATFAVASTAFQMVLGVGAALYAFGLARRPRVWLRALCFVPYLIPAVSSVIMFDFLFDSTTGLLTNLLAGVGFDPDWRSGSKLFALMVIISVWQFAPFVFLIVLARLETIPSGLLEAAEADGAGPVERLRSVLLPQLRETLVAVLLLRLVFMFTKFDIPWLLAGSRGTNRHVETLPVYTYRLAFETRSLGDAAACGVLLFVASAAFVALAMWVTRGKAEA